MLKGLSQPIELLITLVTRLIQYVPCLMTLTKLKPWINFTCFELCQVRALSQDDLINLKSDFLEIIIYEQRLLLSIYSSTCLPCTFPDFPIFFQKPKYNLEKLTVDI